MTHFYAFALCAATLVLVGCGSEHAIGDAGGVGGYASTSPIVTATAAGTGGGDAGASDACNTSANCPVFPHLCTYWLPPGTCAAGACEPGWGDCNGTILDGCETVCPPEGECCAGSDGGGS